jgi:hypothetical protein
VTRAAGSRRRGAAASPAARAWPAALAWPAAWAGAAALAWGCGGAPPPQAQALPGEAEGAGYPGYLVPLSQVRGDFSALQRVSGKFREETFSFSVALQKRGDVLRVVGLTPFNTKAFLIEQRGEAVTFQPFIERELPFPPRYILQDIHRTLFFGIGDGERPLPDGEHRAEREGELIAERWAGGRLLWRRFTRLSGRPAGEIAIVYGAGAAGEGLAAGERPPPMSLSNGWFGYTLQIETDTYARRP